MRTVLILSLPATAAALMLTGCGAGPAVSPGGVVEVVAAESSWGSLAAQVGGAHVRVTSIVANPAVDPHAYEPTTRDARAVAVAPYVVVNGAGYDTWATRLVDADPWSARITLDVADLAGRRQGDNPHLWYDPPVVLRVVRRMAADLARLDPQDVAYFNAREQQLESVGLRRYDDLRATIRARFAGTPVAASESIVEDLAADLGLRLLTPRSFMAAVSEGDEPTSQDRDTAQSQVAQRRAQVLVYNSQNSTPQVAALVDAARAHRVPVVAVTETLSPPSADFQDWQCAQLAALQRALESAA